MKRYLLDIFQRPSGVTIYLGLLVFLTACDEAPKLSALEKAPVEVIYNTALDSLVHKRDFKQASREFDEVCRQHPFSTWAAKAQIMAAYAAYEGGLYEDAIVNLQDFLSLNARHVYAPYAYYLLGMCYFVQMAGVMRDQTMTNIALQTFTSLIKTYPQSSYARDAKFKIDLCLEHLAGHDMEVGRYYQSSSIPISALERFIHVVDTYPTTSHVPEALHRQVEVMITLGMTQQAQVVAATLGYNYPGSKWYGYTYTLMNEKGLLTKEAPVPSRIAAPESPPPAPPTDVSPGSLPF